MITRANRADRIVLHHISWEQFERLLEDLGNHRAARIAYDNGALEIMRSKREHLLTLAQLACCSPYATYAESTAAPIRATGVLAEV